MLILHVRKEVSHFDWLFVSNPRTLLGDNYSLDHQGVNFLTIVRASEQRSGHFTEIANYSYPRLNYS